MDMCGIIIIDTLYEIIIIDTLYEIKISEIWLRSHLFRHTFNSQHVTIAFSMAKPLHSPQSGFRYVQ
jgi:hypothetical protein